MSLKLQAKISRAFIDLGARARAEFDVFYANSCVIMSGFRSTVDDIVRAVGPVFDNIGFPGQTDPLPFSCRANPGIQIMWHKGNNALCHKLHRDERIDANEEHQMMPIPRLTLLSKEVQRKSAVRVEDAVLRRRSSYKSGDCTPPPPPGVPFSPPGLQGDGFGGGFPGATGGYNNIIFSSSSSSNEAIKVNTKNNGKSNSPRKRKSPQNYNEKKQVDEDDDDGDAKMGENLGINLVEDFFVAAGEELRNAAYGKTDY
jgi:hypothetical protein